MIQTTTQTENEVTIRFNATGGSRDEVLKNVGEYLRSESNQHGLTMQSIELNGETISSDEVYNASHENTPS